MSELSLNLFSGDFGRQIKKPSKADFGDNSLSYAERVAVAVYMNRKARDIRLKNEKKARSIVNEAERLMNCGQEGFVFSCERCRSRFFTTIHCKSRICQYCAGVYVKKIKSKVESLIKQTTANKPKGYRLALLTLTVSSSRYGGEIPDREGIRRFYKETAAFLKIHFGKYAGRWGRNGKIVENRKKYVGAGWISAVEVGLDNNNLHCHCLVFGPFRNYWKMLSDWKKLTGDSQGVYIQSIKSPADAVKYVTKYIAKPPVSENYSSLADYAVSIKGSRRFRTGGVFYNRLKLSRADRRRPFCAVCNGRLLPDGIDRIDNLENVLNIWAALNEIESIPAYSFDPIEKTEEKPAAVPISYSLPFCQ